MSYKQVVRRINGNHKSRQAGLKAKRNGDMFEARLDYACQWYRQNGVACIEKTPENIRRIRPLDKGQFVAVYSSDKSQVDYKGVYNGIGVAFEAKHFTGKSLPHARVKEHQLAMLKDFARCGGKSYILASHEDEDIYRIPLETWLRSIKYSGKKSVSLKDMDSYKVGTRGQLIEFLLGIEEEE